MLLENRIDCLLHLVGIWFPPLPNSVFHISYIVKVFDRTGDNGGFEGAFWYLPGRRHLKIYMDGVGTFQDTY